MSFCIRNHQGHHIQSFPEYAKTSSPRNRQTVWQDSYNKFETAHITDTRIPCKKTSLCIRKKASYTLEAAIVIPFVAAFFVAVLFFFRVLQIETQVQEALDYASRKSACEACITDSESVLLASAKAYFLKDIKGYELPAQYVKGGTVGISLLHSDLSDDYVDLRADYHIRLPISFFAVKGIKISQSSKSRKWTGDTGNGQGEEYVYVTETGTVYHRDRMCSYLDLSIQTVNSSGVGGMRNEGGHKYYPCAECAAKNKVGSTVYITDYGTCYHTSLSCGGLKRTIYLIPLSEVGGRGPCSKCGGKGS